MAPEEHLDQMIDQHLSGASWQPDRSDGVAAKLAAAEALANLQMIEPPLSFSDRIEARIRMQARAREPQVHHNGRIISLERIRLNGLAAAQPLPSRRSAGARLTLSSRAWISVLSAVALLVLAFVGVATAAAGSLPGDPLYGLRSFGQQLALSHASSLADRANIQNSQLQSAIADLQAEVTNGHSDDAIRQALDVVARDTRDSQATVNALPAGSAHDAAEQSLANTLQNEEQTLYDLLARVDWWLRVAFTGQLGALGNAVPTITGVTESQGPTNTLIVKLTGTNFAPGVQLVVNGMVRGTVTQSSATTLTAIINRSYWREDDLSVGVLNPDGTAAQKSGGDDGSGGDDDGGVPGTPIPGVTPTPGGSDDGGDGD